MHLLVSGTSEDMPLNDVASTRRIEAEAARHLPAHTLMDRAGTAVAHLTRALAPHARRIWIACGPGNNGGDGLVAATRLHEALGTDTELFVSFHGDAAKLPSDAKWAMEAFLATGLPLRTEMPGHWDFAVDALLGIGADRIPTGALGEVWATLRRSTAPVLHVDIPSGLMADTGQWPAAEVPGSPPHAKRYTLSLLTIKPGLFTAKGRDATGDIWFDDLGIQEVDSSASPHFANPTATLRTHASASESLAHDSHKGSFGNVMVLGGQASSEGRPGMTGAAVLAARAALHAGAGRVYVGLLEQPPAPPTGWDPVSPELMFRTPDLLLDDPLLAQPATCLVCGCGGGSSVAEVLPTALSRAHVAVLDADALNAIATDPQLLDLLQNRGDRGWITVLTPHPLEAARLLDTSTTLIQSDRLGSAVELAKRTKSIVVLKGSGSIVALTGIPPSINFSGNGRLATAGTGDILAGMIGATLARRTSAGPLSPERALHAVQDAVWSHGDIAERWNEQETGRLTASAMAYG